MFVANTVVRNLFHNRFRNLAANGIGLLAVTNFLLHSGAGDGSHLGTWNPPFAADRSAGLLANRVAATRFVHALAPASIPFPCTGIGDTFLHDRTRNLLGFCHPFAGAVGDFLRFANRLADGVTDITITGLGFGAVRGAADFAVLGLTNRLFDGAANIAVAGLKVRLPDRAADIFVARLDAWFADRAGNVFIAGLEAGLPYSALHVLIAGLVDRLVHRVALVTVAGFLNVPCAGDRNLFRAGIVHGTASIDGPLFENGFLHGFIPSSATLGCTVVSAGWTCSR